MKQVLAAGLSEAIEAIMSRIGRAMGVVHKAEPATINGQPGYLVWDYVIYNEITFLPQDPKHDAVSLLTSMSDDVTSKRFDELVAKYGS